LLFFGRQDAKRVLVEERGNDEGAALKSRIFDDRVNPGLVREVGNTVLAAADRFDVWKGRPNEAPNAGFLRGADRCLAQRCFIGAAFLPEAGDGENAVGSLECGFERPGLSLRPLASIPSDGSTRVIWNRRFRKKALLPPPLPSSRTVLAGASPD
jgi:hypothetical protein